VGTFKEDLDQDLTDNFFNPDEFAEVVTIYPAAGGSYTLNAIFDKAFEEVDPETEEPILSTRPILHFKEADLQAEIQPGDEFVVRGVRYTIITHEPDGVGTVMFHLHKKAV